MPEVICTTVYQFPELSDAAKEKARSWYRDLGPHAPDGSQFVRIRTLGGGDGGPDSEHPRRPGDGAAVVRQVRLHPAGCGERGQPEGRSGKH